MWKVTKEGYHTMHILKWSLLFERMTSQNGIISKFFESKIAKISDLLGDARLHYQRYKGTFLNDFSQRSSSPISLMRTRKQKTKIMQTPLQLQTQATPCANLYVALQRQERCPQPEAAVLCVWLPQRPALWEPGPQPAALLEEPGPGSQSLETWPRKGSEETSPSPLCAGIPAARRPAASYTTYSHSNTTGPNGLELARLKPRASRNLSCS